MALFACLAEARRRRVIYRYIIRKVRIGERKEGKLGDEGCASEEGVGRVGCVMSEVVNMLTKRRYY